MTSNFFQMSPMNRNPNVGSVDGVYKTLKLYPDLLLPMLDINNPVLHAFLPKLIEKMALVQDETMLRSLLSTKALFHPAKGILTLQDLHDIYSQTIKPFSSHYTADQKLALELIEVGLKSVDFEADRVGSA